MSFNYSCKRCLKEFKLRIDVARHLSRKHKCKSLDEKFNMTEEEVLEKSMLKNNEDKIENTNYKCEYCLLSFNTENKKERHKQMCSIIYKISKKNDTKIIEKDTEQKKEETIDKSDFNQTNIINTVNNKSIEIKDNTFIHNLTINNITNFFENNNLLSFCKSYDYSHLSITDKYKIVIDYYKDFNLNNILMNERNINMIPCNKIYSYVYLKKNFYKIENLYFYEQFNRKIRSFLLSLNRELFFENKELYSFIKYSINNKKIYINKDNLFNEYKKKIELLIPSKVKDIFNINNDINIKTYNNIIDYFDNKKLLYILNIENFELNEKIKRIKPNGEYEYFDYNKTGALIFF